MRTSLFIYDGDSSPDKREWNQIIPSTVASFSSCNIKFSSSSKISVTGDEGIEIRSGLVIVHWSQVKQSLFCSGLPQSEEGLYFVVISGDGFGAPFYSNHERVYFRRCPVDKPGDPEFSRCFSQFFPRFSEGTPFRECVDLLEPCRLDLLIALLWMCIAQTDGLGPQMPLERWKKTFEKPAAQQKFQREWGLVAGDRRPGKAFEVMQKIVAPAIDEDSGPTRNDYQLALEELRHALANVRSL